MPHALDEEHVLYDEESALASLATKDVCIIPDWWTKYFFLGCLSAHASPGR